MKKASVTYTAPEGDSKVLEWLGQTLYSGVAKELICDEAVIEKLKKNQYFKVGTVSDYTPEPVKEAPKAAPPKEAPKTESQGPVKAEGKSSGGGR